MFSPMFLLPATPTALQNILTVCYYLDGKFTARQTYTLYPNKPKFALYPQSCHSAASNDYSNLRVRYDKFAYPIRGFETGWRDANGQIYPGPDMITVLWENSTFHNKPLGQDKDIIELDIIIDKDILKSRGLGITDIS